MQMKESNILGGDTHPVALGCKDFFFFFFYLILTSLLYFYFNGTVSPKIHLEATLRSVNFFSFFFLLACILTPELNSMHVEANESHFRVSSEKKRTPPPTTTSPPPPSYSNTSQSALGMNTHVFFGVIAPRKKKRTDVVDSFLHIRFVPSLSRRK